VTQKRVKPRSPHAQLTRMSSRWPDFAFDLSIDSTTMIWEGRLRGFQKSYLVSVQWRFREAVVMPHVFILDPKLRPRSGGRYEDIPHLIFNRRNPTESALCLYDPDSREWNSTMLIADTTVPWASEWLHYYECWHLDGIWRGSNAPGPQCIGELYPASASDVAPTSVQSI
jgi:hypothetical protein